MGIKGVIYNTFNSTDLKDENNKIKTKKKKINSGATLPESRPQQQCFHGVALGQGCGLFISILRLVFPQGFVRIQVRC